MSFSFLFFKIRSLLTVNARHNSDEIKNYLKLLSRLEH